MRPRRVAIALIVVLAGTPLAVLLLHVIAPSKPAVRVGASKFDVDVVWTREARREAVARRSAVRPFEPFLIREARPRHLHLNPQGAMRRLDVVFLDASWTVVDAGLLAPGNDEGVTASKEAAAALVVDAGDWARTGAKVGDAATVPDAVKKIQPEERLAVTFAGTAATAYVETALTEAERRRGLMWREHLSADDGMLFKHRAEAPRHYWMKNTRLPLSIAYVREDGAIDTILEMKPLDLDPDEKYRSKGPAMYVLEMNARWFEKHGVREGDTMIVPKDVRDAAVDED